MRVRAWLDTLRLPSRQVLLGRWSATTLQGAQSRIARRCRPLLDWRPPPKPVCTADGDLDAFYLALHTQCTLPKIHSLHRAQEHTMINKVTSIPDDPPACSKRCRRHALRVLQSVCSRIAPGFSQYTTYGWSPSCFAACAMSLSSAS